MAPETQPALLRARSGFLAGRTVVRGGQIVRADDPIVKGRESLFEPADAGVEAATRAPGEVRIGTRRPAGTVVAQAAAKPAKKAAPKKAAS